MAAEVLQPTLEEPWLSDAFPEERTDGIIVKNPMQLFYMDTQLKG